MADRQKEELVNACGICASSDDPIYNMQHSIQINTYMTLVAK